MHQSSRKTISRRWVLGACALSLAAAGGGWILLSRPGFAGNALSPRQAFEAARTGQIYLIDIRRPDEWRETGIAEGAFPIDMRRRDFIQELEKVTGGQRSTAVALICARGVRSAWLSNQLTEAGYTNIINVPEGMLGSREGPGWIRSDLPVQAYTG